MTFKERPTAPIASLRELVGGLGYGEPVVQEFGAPNQVSIRVALPEGAESTPGAATAIGDKVIASVVKAYPDARRDGNDTVSGDSGINGGWNHISRSTVNEFGAGIRRVHDPLANQIA